MTEALKPCPFCGAKAEYIYRDVHMSKWKHSVGCKSSTCGAEGSSCATKADAIAAWNTRATEADPHRFGSPPEPVVNPNEAWCDRYADWYYQGKS